MQFHSYNLSFNKSTTDSNSCIFCSNRLLHVKNQQNQDNYNRGRACEQFTSDKLTTFRKRKSDAGQKSTAAGSEEFSICSHTLKKLDTARF